MDWFTLGPAVLGILFLVALLAGFIDSIAGGGGLLTVPALLAESVGGSFSASLYFIRRGAVNLKEQKLTIALTVV
ncbi:hypothetical protein GCT62_24090, partial [Yersinia enterocolitica]|nr:hypothetical protein [Yersinia enterocolitica]